MSPTSSWPAASSPWSGLQLLLWPLPWSWVGRFSVSLLRCRDGLPPGWRPFRARYPQRCLALPRGTLHRGSGLGKRCCGFLRGLRAAGQNLGDAQLGQVLAVAVASPVVVAAALLEDDDAIAANVTHDLRCDAGAGDQRVADFDATLTGDHQHLAQLDDVARGAMKLLDPEEVIGGDAVLLAAGFHDCIHFFFLVSRPCGAASRGSGLCCFVVVFEALGSVVWRTPRRRPRGRRCKVELSALSSAREAAAAALAIQLATKGARAIRGRPGHGRLANINAAAGRGEVPEWLIGAVSKTVVLARVPGVRIPPSPPFIIITNCYYCIFSIPSIELPIPLPIPKRLMGDQQTKHGQPFGLLRPPPELLLEPWPRAHRTVQSSGGLAATASRLLVFISSLTTLAGETSGAMRTSSRFSLLFHSPKAVKDRFQMRVFPEL